MTNLIFKLKDFHIYINFGKFETDNQQILDNIENIFSVLYKYVSSLEVICLKLRLTIDNYNVQIQFLTILEKILIP